MNLCRSLEIISIFPTSDTLQGSYYQLFSFSHSFPVCQLFLLFLQHTPTCFTFHLSCFLSDSVIGPLDTRFVSGVFVYFHTNPSAFLFTQSPIDFPTSLYQPPIAFNASNEYCSRHAVSFIHPPVLHFVEFHICFPYSLRVSWG